MNTAFSTITTIITFDNDYFTVYIYTLTGEYDQTDQHVHHPIWIQFTTIIHKCEYSIIILVHT